MHSARAGLDRRAGGRARRWCIGGAALALLLAAPVSPATADDASLDREFRELGAGPCQANTGDQVDVLHFHAPDRETCLRFCFVEGFPCSAVDYEPVSFWCRVYFGPVSVPEQPPAAPKTTCYLKSFAAAITGESE